MSINLDVGTRRAGDPHNSPVADTVLPGKLPQPRVVPHHTLLRVVEELQG